MNLMNVAENGGEKKCSYYSRVTRRRRGESTFVLRKFYPSRVLFAEKNLAESVVAASKMKTETAQYFLSIF